VDDEPEFREMLAEYLGGKGFEVVEAGSGEEALLQIPVARPHVVLLDLMMAGIGGMEALQRIKALQPETCVIMVTAVDDLDVARGALSAGATDYVTKPFTFQYLDSVLDIHMPAEALESMTTTENLVAGAEQDSSAEVRETESVITEP
jgi:DNA-binding response OmpR family regulator